MGVGGFRMRINMERVLGPMTCSGSGTSTCQCEVDCASYPGHLHSGLWSGPWVGWLLAGPHTKLPAGLGCGTRVRLTPWGLLGRLGGLP